MSALKPTKGLRIEEVVLISTTFINFQTSLHDKAGRLTLNVRHSSRSTEDRIWCDLTCEATGAVDEKPSWEAKVTFQGLFALEGALDIDRRNIESINAPAIVYAYAREYISDLCRRANVGLVFLPPINFVASAGTDKEPDVNKKDPNA